MKMLLLPENVLSLELYYQWKDSFGQNHESQTKFTPFFKKKSTDIFFQAKKIQIWDHQQLAVPER